MKKGQPISPQDTTSSPPVTCQYFPPLNILLLRLRAPDHFDLCTISTSGSLLLEDSFSGDELTALGVALPVSADLVPWQREQGIHALETAAAGFGDEEPGPAASEHGDDGEEPECAVGRHPTGRCGEKHARDRARIAILVDC